MLALKLFLVPGFLLAISLAGSRWGPVIAGRLAGLPVVAGPILFVIALEQGPAFAAQAAQLTLAAICAAQAFALAYAHAARRLSWPGALMAGLAAWLSVAAAVAQLPMSTGLAAVLALVALLTAPTLFPTVAPLAVSRTPSRSELAARMAAGALLALTVSLAAARLGPTWSGLFALFPVLASLLAVFSHRSQGAAFATLLLRGMATGLYAASSFSLCLALSLPRMGMAPAFLLASLAAVAALALRPPR